MSEQVGPVLEAGEAARAVIAALRERHPDIEVQDRGSYLRVLATRRCGVTRDAIERILGRSFRLPCDLELIMPSFRGTFSVTEDGADWFCEARDG